MHSGKIFLITLGVFAIIVVSKYAKKDRNRNKDSKASVLQSGSYGIVVDESKK